MRRFLYYFPGLPGVNPEMLAARGLWGRFTNFDGSPVNYAVTGLATGPVGSGCIVATGNKPAFYTPERQRWIEGPGCWVGVEDLEFMPRAEDLTRGMRINGHSIPLANQEWVIPLLRSWDTSRLEHVSALPKSIRGILVDGKTRAAVGVAPEYEKYDAMADKIFRNFINQKSLSIDEAFSDCVELLSVNYRIGLEECSLLGLVGAAEALAILAVAIDLPKMKAQAAEFALDGLGQVEPIISGGENG